MTSLRNLAPQECTISRRVRIRAWCAHQATSVRVPRSTPCPARPASTARKEKTTTQATRITSPTPAKRVLTDILPLSLTALSANRAMLASIALRLVRIHQPACAMLVSIVPEVRRVQDLMRTSTTQLPCLQSTRQLADRSAPREVTVSKVLPGPSTAREASITANSGRRLSTIASSAHLANSVSASFRVNRQAPVLTAITAKLVPLWTISSQHSPVLSQT